MASGHLELLQKCGNSPSPLTLGVGARSISCLRGVVKAETEQQWAASEFVRSVGAIQKVFHFSFFKLLYVFIGR